jgi:hypothetical protein
MNCVFIGIVEGRETFLAASLSSINADFVQFILYPDGQQFYFFKYG